MDAVASGDCSTVVLRATILLCATWFRSAAQTWAMFCPPAVPLASPGATRSMPRLTRPLARRVPMGPGGQRQGGEEGQEEDLRLR
eukprot:8563604-Pyramimonas_sp.AAC.1